jgi:hypothetical protein
MRRCRSRLSMNDPPTALVGLQEDLVLTQSRTLGVVFKIEFHTHSRKVVGLHPKHLGVSDLFSSATGCRVQPLPLFCQLAQRTRG